LRIELSGLTSDLAMLPRSTLLASLCFAALFAQAPTAPVIGARGVTNFFMQDPAPGTVGLGGLVQINGLNLGPPEGAVADSIPWPTRLAGVQVVIGGKLAPIYSVSPATIVVQARFQHRAGQRDRAPRWRL